MSQYAMDGRETVSLRGYPNQSLSSQDGSTIYNKFSLELRYPISLKPAAACWLCRPPRACGFCRCGDCRDRFCRRGYAVGCHLLHCDRHAVDRQIGCRTVCDSVRLCRHDRPDAVWLWSFQKQLEAKADLAQQENEQKIKQKTNRTFFKTDHIKKYWYFRSK